LDEVGDIIWYENGYYEIYNLINNQLVVGKDPDYPNQDDNGYNPYGNSDLASFGYDVSIIAEAHYVPADRVGISEERLISSIKNVK
jgi:signal peptidase I